LDAYVAAYPNCTEIAGNLEITTAANPISLDGLENIVSVTGSVLITFNQTLANVSGLQNLTTVGGDFVVFNNDNLTSIAPFSKLSAVGGLVVSGNDALTSLQGLENVVTAGRILEIASNPNVVSIELNALTSVTLINIEVNGSLTDISSLDHAISVTEINILGNGSLATCDVQAVCEHIDANGTLDIQGNATGCDSPQEVETACNPPVCPPTPSVVIQSQADLDAFAQTYPNCTNIVGSIIIQGSTDITNLEGLEGIIVVGSNVVISNNTSLTSLTGLQNLVSLGGNLEINNNPILANEAGGLSGIRNIVVR